MQSESPSNAPFVTEFTFSMIRNVPESAWLGHGPFALWLVEAMRPETIIELGTHNGYSFFSFCQAMTDLGLAGTVHAVDTWAGDPHAGFYGEDIYQSVETVVADQFADTGRLHRMTFDAARALFDKASVDILHIDGLHTYEAVRRDFETWRDTVREGGVVLFHDTQVKRDDFGVWKLWEQLSAEYPSFEFHHSHGLGVIGIGEIFPDALANLFTLRDQAIGEAKVREQFERLGVSLEATLVRRNLLELERHVSDLENSHSWRITTPLRKGQDIFRKLFKFPFRLKRKF